MDFNQDILEMTSELYGSLEYSSDDVQSIVSIFRFIRETYNPRLLSLIKDRTFQAIPSDASQEIERLFVRCQDPFEPFSTHDKRMLLYTKHKLYTEPIDNILKQSVKQKVSGSKITLQSRPYRTYHLSIENSLRKLLEMDGLLPETISYINFAQSQKEVIFNFVQGSLWEEQLKGFDEEYGIVLPLGIYFDDVETGNALGSHAGKNKVGCVYATIPCFPPSFSSKLDSMVLTDIFHSDDRKTFGNENIFGLTIKELRKLREEGITVNVHGKLRKIYFITTLVLGDNLGLDSIQGFVENFASAHFCRICYASAKEAKYMIKEDSSLLRTIKKYEEDVHTLNVSETGVKQQCVFNELDDYNCINNPSVDVMHDVFEGTANYVMARILLALIDEEFFDISYVNTMMHSMDFAFESSNVPLDISLEYVKANGKIKMSASEMLFLTRYSGFIVGYRVPKHHHVWELYIILRDIIHIVTRPNVTSSRLLKFQSLIEEHNNLYIKLFGPLKAKFHFLLHYIRLMLKNGPVIHFSSMQFESKHREVKQIVNSSSSRRNILKTVAKRVELSQMKLKFRKYTNEYVVCGPQLVDQAVNSIFPFASVATAIMKCVINDVTYKKDVIVVIDIDDSGPYFGGITHVYFVDGEIYFQYNPFKVFGFNDHYFGYSVTMDATRSLMAKFCDISVRTPCVMVEINDICYIATRYCI